MTVEESHLNKMGNLHGGMTAMLVDSVSTLAIVSSECHPGVSVDMNISYVSACCGFQGSLLLLVVFYFIYLFIFYFKGSDSPAHIKLFTG